jgi:hypothetical protein
LLQKPDLYKKGFPFFVKVRLFLSTIFCKGQYFRIIFLVYKRYFMKACMIM